MIQMTFNIEISDLVRGTRIGNRIDVKVKELVRELDNAFKNGLIIKGKECKAYQMYGIDFYEDNYHFSQKDFEEIIEE